MLSSERSNAPLEDGGGQVPPFNEAIALLDNQRAAPVRAVLHAFEAYEVAEADLQDRLQRLLGIGSNDLVALRFIRSRELEGDPARPRDVEVRLRTSSAGATAITNRLKAAGLIDKPTHEHDRRARVLTLTSDGRRRLAAALGDSSMAADRLLASVTASDAERLAGVLIALAQIVSETGRGEPISEQLRHDDQTPRS
jgi:DNA-binding MarR family transcriptional regulator